MDHIEDRLPKEERKEKDGVNDVPRGLPGKMAVPALERSVMRDPRACMKGALVDPFSIPGTSPSDVICLFSVEGSIASHHQGARK